MSGSTRTWPYLRAQPSRVGGFPWHLVAGSRELLLKEALEHWDPSTDLSLRRRIRVDIDSILADCALPPGTPLRVLASWHCEGTTLRGVGTSTLLPTTGLTEVFLDIVMAGIRLGGKLFLNVSVVLGRKLEPRPLMPYRAGTILWEDSHELRLEGSGSRFPMEEVSFSAAGWEFPPNAAWRLEWERGDLELPVLGSVRLYLNRDHPVVQEMIHHPDAPTSQLITSAVQFDIARSLIRGALLEDDFHVRSAPWPSDSVGRAIERLLKSRFKTMSPLALREVLRSDPDQFEAMLQSNLGLFHLA